MESALAALFQFSPGLQPGAVPELFRVPNQSTDRRIIALRVIAGHRGTGATLHFQRPSPVNTRPLLRASAVALHDVGETLVLTGVPGADIGRPLAGRSERGANPVWRRAAWDVPCGHALGCG